MGSMINMFKTIMWKNCILRKRHWIMTILEAVVPCALFGFLFWGSLQTKLPPETFNNESIPLSYSLDSCFKNLDQSYTVVYTPNNSFTNEFMSKVKERIWSTPSDQDPQHVTHSIFLKEFTAVNTEFDLESYFDLFIKNDTRSRRTIFYGIVFGDNQKKFQYKIRVGNTNRFETALLYPLIVDGNQGMSEGDVYRSSCFLELQKTIDSIHLETVTKKSTEPEIMMRQFPYPSYKARDDPFISALRLAVPYLVLFSFCIILPNLIKRVVEEKETGVKELMKMMGLRTWMVWVGWLLHANMINIFVTTVITALLVVQVDNDHPAIMANANPIFVWLLLFLFMNATTIYLFVICALIHRPLIASSIGMFVYFVPTISIDSIPYIKTHVPLKLLSCILPPRAMFVGFEIIKEFLSRGSGVHFSNLFVSPSYSQRGLSLGLIFLVFLLDMLIFGIIVWYVDQVRPGPFGRAKPWHFVFKIFDKKKDSVVIQDDDDIDPKYFEHPPENIPVGLSVRNLRKVFPPNIHAVNGVNIDIYKGKITALLGHNGAGKTTTMSILTGMFSPTTGTVRQYGSDGDCIDIFEDMDQFRQDLGLCPQHNMLFSYFTVIQHLQFFGMLKGMSSRTAKADGLELLRTLNILDKENKPSSELSGGMKRKLSLAISLIASPKVLMLDEPTSGMDPESRREMWDILLNIRENRTIIITTHFMEEADVLGDRIAIMDHGKICCYGTSMFLKKAYGAGYNMTLLTLQNTDVQKISEIVKRVVPGSKLKSLHQGQLVYNLPSEQSSEFAELFAKIENDKAALNVTSIGVSCTTMEDVFLKVGELSEKEKNQDDRSSTSSNQENNFKTSSTEHLSPKRITGVQLLFTQFWLLLLKKMRFTYRNKWSFLFYVVLCIVMVAIAIQATSQPLVDQENPSLKLDVNLYEETKVYVTYNEKSNVLPLVKTYESLITAPSVHLLPDKDITTELLDIAKKDIQSYKVDVLLAADFPDEKNITALYSDVAIHASPISLNLITNTLLKSYDKDHSIATVCHPLTKVTRCSGEGIQANKYYLALRWSMTIPFGLLFLVANFMAFPLHERVKCAKHLQFMTGLSPLMYWIASFIWDYFVFFVTSLLLLIPVLIFDVLHMFSNYEIGVFFLICNLYGLCGIPFSYFFSFLKDSPQGASASFVFFNILFGVFGLIVVMLLSVLQIVRQSIINVLIALLTLNPFYCIVAVVWKFCFITYDNVMCKICPQVPCSVDTYFMLKDPTAGTYSGNGFYLLCLVFDAVFYFAIVILIDYGLVGKLFNFVKRYFVKKGDVRDLDQDVKDEVDRVDAAMINKNDMLLVSPVMMVDGLKKTYGFSFPAVRGVSFVVNSGECFGLLGVNGAGKTTTFKMLTGEEIPTAGTATIGGYSLADNRTKFLKQIGYCPQFDAINEMMTGREMIFLFAQLRGIDREDAEHFTNYWLKFLGLEEYSERLSGTYSGGNKRKLSTAMALVGDPIIVFLDEPTSGVDPVARRKLWSVLARCQKAGQSIVLTSHSMDECEALCNRLTIMVRGQMVCIGNIQYLKQKFGQGFTIMVNLHSVEIDSPVIRSLKGDIEDSFAPGCVLKDEHTGLLHYHVTDTSKTWSVLFQSMYEIKKKHAAVKDYTISETTLEQVFISFAKQDKK